MKSDLTQWMNHLLVRLGIQAHVADLWDQAVTILLILCLAVLSAFVMRFLLVNVMYHFVRNHKVSHLWLNIHSLKIIAYFAPVAIIYTLIPLAFPPGAKALPWIERICGIYIIVTIIVLINELLKLAFDIFNRREEFRDRPLKGALQILQVILFFVGTIVIVGVLIHRSPARLLTGLGASAAVLMLIFKDSILGFVSGIMLSANHMLRPGDWITMPSYNVDGTVMEVTLNTVKIENFDNTITTIPPYALITSSFQNWRGMEESGGRRIMRSVNIDIGSVRFCTPEMLERYKQLPYMKEYLERHRYEVPKPGTADASAAIPSGETQPSTSAPSAQDAPSGDAAAADGDPAQEFAFTNIGLFRAYLTLYIEHLSVANLDLTYMVRHLQPTEYGIPIQLYFFSKEKEWVAYEGIQADVFDHVMAIAPCFDLEIYQQPSGGDLHTLGRGTVSRTEKQEGPVAKENAAKI